MFKFIYVENPEVSVEKGYIAVVPTGLSSKEELLNALHELLLFPDYDGRNWDALYDLLCSFEWIENDDIYLIHKELPCLSDNEINNYLEVLNDSIESWEKHNPFEKGRSDPPLVHHLRVIFPLAEKERIEHIQDR